MSAVRSRAALAALVVAAVAVILPPARADDPRPAKQSSLAQVPADAAFFSANLRWKEQIDLFYNSRAYKALRALPTVKKSYDEAIAKSKDGLKFFSSDLGKDIAQVLSEAGSDETFWYGGADWNDFLRTVNGISQAQNVGTYSALLSGSNPSTAQGRSVLRALNKDRSKVKIPGLVFGFKLATPAKAEKLLDKVGKIAVGLTVGIKELEDKIETKKVAGGKFLTVELDGSQIPWDMVPFGDLEEKKGEFDDLVAHLKKAKLTVALGVTGNYLLLSIGEGLKDLEAFAAGGAKLIDHEALKVVRDLGGKRFTSLGYSSKAFLEAASGGGVAPQYANLIASLKEAVKGADMKEDRKKAILKEMDEVVTSLKKAGQTVFGPNVSYSHLTAYGYEAVVHDTTAHPGLDKVQFGLMPHFGEQPLFAAGFGFPVDGSVYAEMVRLGKRVYPIAEGMYLDAADAAAADDFRKTTKALFPILEKIDATLTKKVLPAMAQSGLGLVVDGKWKSKQWSTTGAATDKEMPMAELGLLIGVSDAKGFDAGLKDLRANLNELFAKWSEYPGGPPPGFAIPEPAAADGLFSWPVPDSPLDKQVVLTAGSGKAASVLALSKAHAARLVKATPLKARAKELAIDGDVLGCCVLDWIGVMELATPWVDYAVETSVRDFGADAKMGKQWAKEAKTALLVMKAFKGSTTTTKKAAVGMIHRTAIVIQDLDALPDPID